MLSKWDQLKFGKAFLGLVRDPRDTEQVFNMADIGLKQTNSTLIKPVVDAAMSHSEFRKLYEAGYLAPKIDLNELAQLPDHTLGFAFARHMRTNNLDVDFYRHLEPSEPIRYIALRARQCHDIWHVLTGYGTIVKDELALQAFTLAQLRTGISATLLAAGLLHTVKTASEELIEVMDVVVDGYSRGRRANFMLGIAWEKMWDKSLRDAQTLAGLL